MLNCRIAARSIYGYDGDFCPDTAIQPDQEAQPKPKGEFNRPIDQRKWTFSTTEKTLLFALAHVGHENSTRQYFLVMSRLSLPFRVGIFAILSNF